MTGAATSHLSGRIVFFGDSICFGQGISPHLTWVSRLSCEVERRYDSSSNAPIVHNTSINGNTTRQALERMAFDVQSHGVDAMVLQFGLNDANFWVTDRGLPRVSEAAFCANIEEIIARAVKFGARHIQLHTNHPVAKVLSAEPFFEISYAESVLRYNNSIRTIAARHGLNITLVDIEAAWAAHLQRSGGSLTDLLLPDGVHLSLNGHTLYFQSTIAPFIAMLQSIYG